MDGKTFLIQSVYDHKALTALCRARRKTLGRVLSIVLRIFGWTAVGLMTALQLLLAVMGAFLFDSDEFLILLVMAVMIALMLGEDHLNAWIASFNLVPGSKDSKTRFTEAEYVCDNDAAVTQFPYENIGSSCSSWENGTGRFTPSPPSWRGRRRTSARLSRRKPERKSGTSSDGGKRGSLTAESAVP